MSRWMLDHEMMTPPSLSDRHGDSDGESADSDSDSESARERELYFDRRVGGLAQSPPRWPGLGVADSESDSDSDSESESGET